MIHDKAVVRSDVSKKTWEEEWVGMEMNSFPGERLFQPRKADLIECHVLLTSFTLTSWSLVSDPG